MSAGNNKRILFAIGGNSLISDEQHITVEDQLAALKETTAQIAAILKGGHNAIVTHGNGPQVGFILQRSEIAFETAHMHSVPLANCNADTQGAIGYGLQQTLDNEFSKNNINSHAVTLVTQVIVDENDPALLTPDKPIGKFYHAEEYEKLCKTHPHWKLVEDSGRGFRRVVPSPRPREIVEIDAIRSLFDNGYTVIAAGGGGIPVILKNNELIGLEAIIDKDRTSALLAIKMDIDVLVISTGIENVFINFRSENQQKLDDVSLRDVKKYLIEDQFAPGSMRPKIEAAIRFLENGGREVIITNPQNLLKAFKGGAGTHIFP